jgi:hypothetical protein
MGQLVEQRGYATLDQQRWTIHDFQFQCRSLRPTISVTITDCHRNRRRVMSITYARFTDHTLARKASEAVRRRIGAAGRVELLRSPRRLSHHTIPLRMTAARVGSIIGAVVVGLLSVLTLAAGLWVLSTNGRPIPCPAETLALGVVLSSLLGGLAGALSFASDNAPTVHDLRAWLGKGNPVVLVDAERGHEETLRGLGADQAGRIG